MQNDLISRSAAMENYCNALCHKLQKGEYCHKCLVKSWLNNQPTAYDVDAVVEQLDNMSGIQFDGDNESYQLDWCIEKNRAIDIVRKGGVE